MTWYSRTVPVVVFAAMLLTGGAASSGQPDARWIVVSDIHFSPFVSPGESDTSGAALDAAIAYMKQRQPDASVVAIAGNLLAHRFAERARVTFPRRDPVTVAESAMREIAQKFDRAFPRAQFLVALGDDDDLCGASHTTTEGSYLRALATIWEPLVDRNGAAPDFIRTFSTGGYYTARVGNGHLRAVVANTTYWSSVRGSACARQFQRAGEAELRWFERTLGSTAPSDVNVVLLHLPPGVAAFADAIRSGTSAFTYLDPRANQAVTQIFADPKYRVSTAIAGHVERTEFRWFNGTPMLIVPSLARPVTGVPTFLIADVTPSATLSPSSPLINDFAAFMDHSGQWGGAYDFDDTFKEDAFDASAIQDIHQRLFHGWRPPASTNFTVDATTYCAQNELEADYVACVNHTQQ